MEAKNLLKKISFNEQFEYEIKKDEKLYIVGIKEVRLQKDATFSCRLYLDELSRWKEKRIEPFLARPIFPSPSYNPCYTETREKRKRIFSISRVKMTKTLEQFIEDIQNRLLVQNQFKMETGNIAFFFKKIHKKYWENS